MRRILFMALCFFCFTSWAIATPLPGIEIPDFGNPKQIYKSVDRLNRNIKNAIDSDSVEEGWATGVLELCYEVRYQIEEGFKKRSYTQKLAKKQWHECYNAYQNLR